MSEVEKVKQNIVNQLTGLCAHCACGRTDDHACPIKPLALRVQSLTGVPLIVNSEFKGVFWK